ncbi:shikimate kinase [Rubricoccus marinus]|uniref:Shikimate kinase n=1 Tax=Rubricoccus marinus TaxID=716817 RepID=A0A259U1H6_9BACT|nr:shikimate kinase [Rubricoccus marinus]OZC03800.1 hypothetical protein BSZ36_12880 [Rubricoccus marinus]
MTPRVYLTGFMASGKSTVGPLVADALGYRFLDLDWLVVVRTGKSIPEIFAEGGAEAFRKAEAQALEETTRGESHVIASGGGSLVQPGAMDLAKGAGTVVWLRTSPETVARRVGSAGDRPMLWGDDGRPLAGAPLRQRIRELMNEREPSYAHADLTVDADASPEAVARAVVEAVRAL